MQIPSVRFQGYYTLPKAEGADWPLKDELGIYRTLRTAQEKVEQRGLRQVSLPEGKFPVFFTIRNEDGYAVLCPDEFDEVITETFTEIRDAAHQTGHDLPEFIRHNDVGEISRTTYAVFHALIHTYATTFLKATSLSDLQDKVKDAIGIAKTAEVIRPVT